MPSGRKRTPRRPTSGSASLPSRRRKRLPRSAKRLIAMFFIFSLAFLAMAVRLVSLQIVEAPAYAKLAANQREREIVFPARRGAILDRAGEPLAISVDLHMVYTDHIHVKNDALTAAKLGRVLGVDAAEIEEKLKSDFVGDQFDFIARQVPPKKARRIKALDLDGIYMKTEPKRFYPGGRLASHVIGFADIDG